MRVTFKTDLSASKSVQFLFFQLSVNGREKLKLDKIEKMRELPRNIFINEVVVFYGFVDNIFFLQFQANFLVGEKNLPGSGSGSRFLAGSGFNEYGSETLVVLNREWQIVIKN